MGDKNDEPTGEELLAQAGSQIALAMQEEASDAEFEEVNEEEEEESEEFDESEEADAAEDDAEDESFEEDDDIDDELDEQEEAEMRRARRAGWRPKEEYKGNPKDWKDYKEFNAVGDRITSKLNAKIDNLTQQNSKQSEMINKLIKAQGAIMKKAQEKALADLEEQRRESIKYGDIDAVEALDEEIETAKQLNDELELDAVDEKPNEQPQIDDEVAEFMEVEKSWFNKSNPDMVQYAVMIENLERQSDPSATSGEIMAKVKEAIVHRFPERIGVKSKEPKQRKRGKQLRASDVEGGEPVARTRGNKLSDYPPEVAQMAEMFEKSGGLSKQEYLKLLKEGAQ